MPNIRGDWDKRIPALGLSAREFVRQNAPAMSDSQLVHALGKVGFACSQDGIGNMRRRLDIVKDHLGVASFQSLRESQYARYDEPPVIEGDVVVMPDLQFPFHHAGFTNKVIGLCRAWGITRAVLAGDVIENSALTHFDPNWAKADRDGIPDEAVDKLLDIKAKLPGKLSAELGVILEKHGRAERTSVTAAVEWRDARKLIQVMRGLFDKLDWVLGNHEGRLLRQLQSPFLPEQMRAMFVGDDAKVTIAPYYYAIVKSKGVEWRVTHPKSSGKGDSKWYASKFLSNIIMAHSHHLLMQKDRSGRYWAIETGCMVDEARLPYTSQRDTKMDAHLLGATIIRDGKAWLLHEDTDWARMAKL